MQAQKQSSQTMIEKSATSDSNLLNSIVLQPTAKQTPQIFEFLCSIVHGRVHFAERSASITHFAPVGNSDCLKATAQFFPLAFGLFEAVLGNEFPYGALQQVVMGSSEGPVRPIAAAGLQILPSTMLFSSICFEEVCRRHAMGSCIEEVFVIHCSHCFGALWLQNERVAAGSRSATSRRGRAGSAMVWGVHAAKSAS